MLAEAGRGARSPKGRFRLWTIEVDGAVISAHLFVEAGGDLVYWLGGIDDEWASNRRPGLLAILAATEDAMGRDDTGSTSGRATSPTSTAFPTARTLLAWTTLTIVL